MKNIAFLFLILSATSFAHANSIQEFYGKYRGLGPTDSSPVAMGEVQITISESGVDVVMATGSKVIEEHADIMFTKMSAEEVAGIFKPGSDQPQRLAGFSSNGSYPYFLFLVDKFQEGDFSLLKLNAPDSMAGIMMPFEPYYIESSPEALDVFNKIVQELSGRLPLIKNKGIALD